LQTKPDPKTVLACLSNQLGFPQRLAAGSSIAADGTAFSFPLSVLGGCGTAVLPGLFCSGQNKPPVTQVVVCFVLKTPGNYLEVGRKSVSLQPANEGMRLFIEGKAGLMGKRGWPESKKK